MALDQTISKFQEQIYGSSSFDISKSFLPDNEIVKNFIKSKNPNMTKEQLDQMVDGKKPKGVKKLPKVYQAKKGEMSQAGNQYKPEIKKIKEKVRTAATQLIKEQKALIQDLIKTAIQTGTAIAGAAQLIAPLSFNVPGAINLILLIIDAISKIINKLLDILVHLEPLKYLKLLIDPKKFEAITAPINIALQILIGIFSPISALKAFIDLLMGQLKSKTSPENLKDEIQQTKDKIAKDKSDIANTKEEETDKRDRLNKDIAHQNEILNQLTSTNIPVTINGEFDETELNKFHPDLYVTLNSIKDVSEKIASGEHHLYDVKLPNGNKLVNINDDALEQLRNTYRVVFEDGLNTD